MTSNIDQKRTSAELTEEERTPNSRLKSIEPDLTVVVGGVVFYHYKLLLCTGCPLIDTMLSSKIGMKESKENRIEFSDRDPDLWLTVYSFLDPTKSDTSKDEIIDSLLSSKDTHLTKPAALLTWFDFLSMGSLVKKYDKRIAENLKVVYEDKYSNYCSAWCSFKYLPCPHVQKIMRAAIKHDFLVTASNLSRSDMPIPAYFIEKVLKPYLLDDQVGDELWQFVLSNVDFPNRMVEGMDRETIVSSPFFVYILEVCGRSLKKPKSFAKFFEDIENGSESK